MRPISDTLRRRFESDLQTAANNADPRLWALLSRDSIPLISAGDLERSVILETEGLRACSVAVRRPRADREPDAVFAAYVDETGAHVKKSALSAKLSAFVWEDAGFEEPDALDIALAFDGTMPKKPDGTAQLVTDARPWVFWIEPGGVLKGRILGLLGDTTLATANATAVSAIRATWTPGASADFGLVVFFLLSGALYYRQLIDGVWMDAEPVTFGPDGVTWTDVAAWRTWDYRTGVQLLGSDGKVYELFSQFQGIAKHGAEHLALDVRVLSALPPVVESGAQEREHLELDVAASGSPLYRTGAPQIVAAANADDGAGNWGKRAVFEFDRHLDPAEVAAQPSAFQIEDADGLRFFASSAAVGADGMTVSLTFPDFNNASGVCKAQYVPGSVHSMAGDLLTATEHAFTPENLDPSGLPLPEITAAENDGAAEILLTFTQDLTDAPAGAAAHFSVTLQAPEYSPGGQMLTEVRAVAAISMSDPDSLTLTLTPGSRTDIGNAVGPVTVAYDGAGALMGAGGTVQPFEISFTPSNLVPKWDPMDAEHIELAVAAAGALTPIVWSYAQGPEHLELGVTASGVLTHIDDL